MGYHASYYRGIVKYARARSLSQNLVKVAMINLQTVARHKVGHKRRRLFLAHRRQLCHVADNHHAAVVASIHEAHHIVEQTARAKTAPSAPPPLAIIEASSTMKSVS